MIRAATTSDKTTARISANASDDPADTSARGIPRP